jgi:hypothetical protein
MNQGAFDPATFDTAAYVDQMAIVLDLPINPSYRAEVEANLTRIVTIAQQVLEFPLPEEIVAAPVFEP